MDLTLTYDHLRRGAHHPLRAAWRMPRLRLGVAQPGERRAAVLLVPWAPYRWIRLDGGLLVRP